MICMNLIGLYAQFVNLKIWRLSYISKLGTAQESVYYEQIGTIYKCTDFTGQFV